jgi:hypothetical protein
MPGDPHSSNRYLSAVRWPIIRWLLKVRNAAAMTLFAVLITLVIAGVIRCSPNSPLGRTLKIYLAERPVKAASKIERHHIIWIAVVLLMIWVGIQLLMAAAGAEIMTAFGSDFLFAYSLDLSLYLDAVVVASAIATASRLRTVMLHTQLKMKRWKGSIGSGGTRATRPRAKKRRQALPRNDNDEEGRLPAVLAA